MYEIGPLFPPENNANPIRITMDHEEILEFCQHLLVIIGYENLCEH